MIEFKYYIVIILLLLFARYIFLKICKKKHRKAYSFITFLICLIIFLNIYVVCSVIKPSIILNGKSIVTIDVDSKYVESGYKVSYFTDKYKNKVDVNTNLDTTKVGEYEIVYSVDFGNKKIAKTRKVNVIDTEVPVISLIGDNPITIHVDDEYIEPGYTALDNYDGDITSLVSIESNLKNEVGNYEINYSVVDSNGNKSTIKRDVIVDVKHVGDIYFTFDDGPSNSTSKILDILKKYDIKATFFVLNFSDSYDSVIKRMKDEGHTVALHSYTHNYKLIYSSENAYYDDLTKLQNRVFEITGDKSMIIRFPGGSSNTVSSFNKGIMSKLTKSVKSNGYHYFDWNVDSSDAWSAKNSTDVYNNVINGLRKNRNNIVLMHDFSNNNKTIDALEKIIIKAKKSGYDFKNITMDTPMVTHGIKN